VKLSFEKLGWIKCGWSGFSFQFNEEMDDACGGGHHYSNVYIVLGFWVYEFRIWVKEQPA
jgi:hypothetical protein